MGGCAGTSLDLVGDVLVRGVRLADAAGTAAFKGDLPGIVCGSSIQVVDVTTCEASNVEELSTPMASSTASTIASGATTSGIANS